MRSVLFNINSTMMPENESANIRVAYILADKVVLAGNSFMQIDAENVFGTANMRQKIKLLEQESIRTENKELQEMLITVKDSYQKYNSIKHKSGLVIGSYKKLEHSFNAIYTGYKDWLVGYLRSTGITQIYDLVDGKTIWFHAIYTDTREKIRLPDQETTASTLLQGILLDPEHGPHIFTLPAEFMQKPFSGDRRYYSVGDREALDTTNVYLEECFTMPGLNFFTALELKSLRKELGDAGAAFRQKTDEWLNLCSETDDVETRVNFLKDQVMPASKAMAAVLENNPLLEQNRIANKTKGLQTHVYMGEVPVEYIWHFYRHCHVIGDETWDKLMAAKETNPSLRLRWPVMATKITVFGEDYKPIKKDGPESEIIAPVKKSIDVD